MYRLFFLFKYVIRYIASIFLNRNTDPKIAKYCDKVLIFGNGPSLRKTIEKYDLKKISTSYDIFCVNSFVYQDEYLIVKPKGYFICDPAFFSNSKHRSENGIKLFNALVERTKWEMVLYVPLRFFCDKILKETLSKNSNIRIVYINDLNAGFLPMWLLFRAYDSQIFCPRLQNVIVSCVYISIFSGYRETFIVGADHDWHKDLYVDNENVLHVKDYHYYDEKDKVSYTPIYKDKNNGVRFSVSEIFLAYHRVHRSYSMLKFYANYKGVSVYNSSLNSFIDSFERKSLIC